MGFDSQKEFLESIKAASKKLKTPEPLEGTDNSHEKRVALKALVKGNNEFAIDLYGQLRGHKEGNLFFSPLSISLAIAMVYAGAKEGTEIEIAQVLHFTLGKEKVHEYFKILKDFLVASAERRGYQLDIANALWAQPGLDFLEGFKAVIDASYGGALLETDFSNPGQAAKQINDWIAGQTNNKITDLIDPGALGKATTLVVTNAIYFLGKWLHEFKKERTTPMLFWTSQTDNITVHMMYQIAKFEYAAGPGFQVLEMPYKGDDNLSMVIFLPSSRDGLPSLEQALTAEKMEGWLDQLRPNLAKVYVPRFTMTLGFSAKKMLEALGMKSAFSIEDANFLGMTEEPSYFIEDVIHKAYVRVDEQGTEAAAATAMPATATGPPPKIVTFMADHPFMFLIRDVKTSTVLFLGRVNKPEE
ncbi:MAG: serpin family protein [Candidatus Hodarchaeota archaeon]